uniref:Uncharacterized protein n=1 Tax=Micrurus paraensis TaxID=1970185 RepID=A0A2D4K6A8_9SAUR
MDRSRKLQGISLNLKECQLSHWVRQQKKLLGHFFLLKIPYGYRSSKASPNYFVCKQHRTTFLPHTPRTSHCPLSTNHLHSLCLGNGLSASDVPQLVTLGC